MNIGAKILKSLTISEIRKIWSKRSSKAASWSINLYNYFREQFTNI